MGNLAQKSMNANIKFNTSCHLVHLYCRAHKSKNKGFTDAIVLVLYM